MDITIIYKQERENLIIPSHPFQGCREIFDWWTMEDNQQDEKEYKIKPINGNDVKVKLVRDNISDIIMLADKNEIENRKNIIKKVKEKKANPLA